MSRNAMILGSTTGMAATPLHHLRSPMGVSEDGGGTGMEGHPWGEPEHLRLIPSPQILVAHCRVLHAIPSRPFVPAFSLGLSPGHDDAIVAWLAEAMLQIHASANLQDA